ncbi:MAG: cyclic nucleotide-binding domain-containing protein [Candidatus Dormibacteraeota bacterium]|nr:cyclic nucleotide-binding domain-containing protein [Candidatus Dormibacteraeota bacterium]
MKALEDRPYDLSKAGDAEPTVAVARDLASSPVFEGLRSHEVDAILGAFHEQSFNAGHRVTLEGFRGSEFYLIASGTAAVDAGGRAVARLAAGDFFGEMALLGDGMRSATVVAETPMRCLVLPNNTLEQLLVAHPRLGLNLLREVVARLKDTTERPDVRVLDS